MAWMRWVVAVAVSCAAVAVGGCSRETPREGPMRVVVSIPPLAGLIEPVLPEGSEVRVIIPEGASPHGYEPTPSDVAALRDADLVVFVGLGIEGGLTAQLDRAGRAGVRSVSFARVAGLSGAGHDHDHDHSHDHDHAHDHNHNHGHDGDHEDHDCATHVGTDPHLWLDPALCLKLIDEVERQAAEARPLDTEAIATGATAARVAIESARADAQATLDGVQGVAIVTDHDAFGRFAMAFGVSVAGVVRGTGHGEPTAGELETVRELLASGAVAGVFDEPQLDGRLARRLAEEAGVPAGTLDPIGGRDWGATLRANAREIVRVVSGG